MSDGTKHAAANDTKSATTWYARGTPKGNHLAGQRDYRRTGTIPDNDMRPEHSQVESLPRAKTGPGERLHRMYKFLPPYLGKPFDSFVV